MNAKNLINICWTTFTTNCRPGVGKEEMKKFIKHCSYIQQVYEIIEDLEKHV